MLWVFVVVVRTVDLIFVTCVKPPIEALDAFVSIPVAVCVDVTSRHILLDTKRTRRKMVLQCVNRRSPSPSPKACRVPPADMVGRSTFRLVGQTCHKMNSHTMHQFVRPEEEFYWCRIVAELHQCRRKCCFDWLMVGTLFSKCHNVCTIGTVLPFLTDHCHSLDPDTAPV